MSIKTYFPILDWGRRYNRQTLTHDLVAAVIVTIMLIPQSLAYALLAILVVGQYSSFYRRSQRAMTAQVAEAWADLPAQAIPGQISEADRTTITTVCES